MKPSYRSLLVIVGVAAVAGCIDLASERATLTKVPQVVRPAGTAFYGKDGIHAPGPVSQLCLDFPDIYVIKRGSSANAAAVRRLDGKTVELKATLIDPDSQRTTLPFASVEVEGKTRSACFERNAARDTNRRYSRGELVADDSITVFQIRWSSGKRITSPR